MLSVEPKLSFVAAEQSPQREELDKMNFMSPSLSRLLHCPFCGGDLKAREKKHVTGESSYGVLSCHCGRYPVVAGIPVLKKGVVTADHQTADQVIRMIEGGRHREALLSMLMPPAPLSAEMAPAWLRALPSIRGIGRLKSVTGYPALRAWKKRAGAFLMGLDNHVTACDLFDLYFCYSTGDGREPYSYYAYRFGQPRHLVALSLIGMIEKPTKPVLELGCGFGHITRSLAGRVKGQPVIGLDRNFFALYVAKNWFAPTAEYVCAEADIGLPFSDGIFSAVFSSDAFHWFTNKLTSFRELRRLTQNDGFIVLATLRNGLLARDLYPGTLPPEGYEALVGDIPHRLVSNGDILARYLKKQGPPLAHPSEIGRLASEPWLSLVASHRQELFQNYGAFKDWPHAEGRLSLNPLYKEESRDGLGNVHLRHTFPSSWYEKENGECRQYEPEIVSISSKLAADLAHGEQTPEVERLIRQCVVIGMPERFR